MSQSLGWNSSEQGLVLSGFFWGYMTTQVLGGYLAEKYGGVRVLLGGSLSFYVEVHKLAAVLTWSLFTLLTPIAAELSLPILLAVRAGMGFGEGMALPAVHALLSRFVFLFRYHQTSIQMDAVRRAFGDSLSCSHWPSRRDDPCIVLVSVGCILVASSLLLLGFPGPALVCCCLLLGIQRPFSS